MATACAYFFRRRWLGKHARHKILRYWRALFYTFNIHTLVMSGVACLAVYLCDVYDFKYNMDFTLVATGTTFPLVFTIQQAFVRRERATILLADMKASVMGLFYMHRDWDQSENFPGSLGNNSNTWCKGVREVLKDFLINLHGFLTMTDGFENIAEKRLTARQHELIDLLFNKVRLNSNPADHTFARLMTEFDKRDPGKKLLAKCYKNLSKLSVMNEQLTLKAGYTRGGEGGMSRTAQYLRYMVNHLEQLRMIRDYRTPSMMRHASGVLLHVFSVILAPYFLHFCDSWVSYGHEEETCPAGYAAAIVYVMIVMLLFHVQTDLEDPFACLGLDDVFVELAEELEDAIDCEEAAAKVLSACSSLRMSMDLDHSHLNTPSAGPQKPASHIISRANSHAAAIDEVHWAGLVAGSSRCGEQSETDLTAPHMHAGLQMSATRASSSGAPTSSTAHPVCAGSGHPFSHTPSNAANTGHPLPGTSPTASSSSYRVYNKTDSAPLLTAYTLGVSHQQLPPHLMAAASNWPPGIAQSIPEDNMEAATQLSFSLQPPKTTHTNPEDRSAAVHLSQGTSTSYLQRSAQGAPAGGLVTAAGLAVGGGSGVDMAAGSLANIQPTMAGHHASHFTPSSSQLYTLHMAHGSCQGGGSSSFESLLSPTSPAP